VILKNCILLHKGLYLIKSAIIFFKMTKRIIKSSIRSYKGTDEILLTNF